MPSSVANFSVDLSPSTTKAASFRSKGSLKSSASVSVTWRDWLSSAFCRLFPGDLAKFDIRISRFVLFSAVFP